MKTIIAALAASALLMGCGPDPKTTAKMKDMEERLAKLEAAPPAGPGQARKVDPVDQEMEKKASEVLKAANTAFVEGKYDEARASLTKLCGEFPKSRACRAGKRIEEELAVIGKPAGDMSVETWFQGDTKLTDGKATLLVFWEVWCPHCKREVPKMEATYNKYKSKGLNMVGLTKMTRGITEDQVKEFISTNNVTYPMAKEQGQAMSDHFGVKGIPAAAVVKDGKVVWRGHPARITDQMIDGWVD